jgi:hypothetical protein
MHPQAQWYEAERDDRYAAWSVAKCVICELIKTYCRCLEPAREAFQEAVSIFRSTLTFDERKQSLASQATSLEDLQHTIIATRTKYDAQQKDHRASKWLTKFSYRVRYYGNIMDVLVQHHSEYASLAWGVMRMLFVVRNTR